MTVTEEFLTRYRREFDFYDRAARIASDRLDARLQATGIRAMVTSRAKHPKRLSDKLQQRGLKRTYISVDDIYQDVVDLAGVRIALYFPGDHFEVDKIIRDQFILLELPKDFPAASQPTSDKRFSGYWASHYRAILDPRYLNSHEEQYSTARIEIQVASVLMHAWAEVEHDLVYKPQQGVLSEDELAILDLLNGMVLAGETALERLQKAMHRRIGRNDIPFNNHFELAAFLFERAKLQGASNPILGEVDLLFSLLQTLKLAQPDRVAPFLEALDAKLETRPVAQQIIDRVVAAAPDRYNVYASLRAANEASTALSPPTEPPAHSPASTEAFLSRWIMLERVLRDLATHRGLSSRAGAAISTTLVRLLELFDEPALTEVHRLRQIRNALVHGGTAGLLPDSPNATDISALEGLLRCLLEAEPADVREAVATAGVKELLDAASPASQTKAYQ